MPVIHSKDVDVVSPLPGFDLQIMVANNHGSQAITLVAETLHPGARIPNHRHKVEGAIYVYQGTGYITIEGEQTYKLEPGTAALVPANSFYYFGNDGAEDLQLVTAHPAVEITKEEKEDD